MRVVSHCMPLADGIETTHACPARRFVPKKAGKVLTPNTRKYCSRLAGTASARYHPTFSFYTRLSPFSSAEHMAENSLLQVCLSLDSSVSKLHHGEFSRTSTTPESTSNYHQKWAPSLSQDHLLRLSTVKWLPYLLVARTHPTEYPARTLQSNRHPHSQPLQTSQLQVPKQRKL